MVVKILTYVACFHIVGYYEKLAASAEKPKSSCRRKGFRIYQDCGKSHTHAWDFGKNAYLGILVDFDTRRPI